MTIEKIIEQFNTYVEYYRKKININAFGHIIIHKSNITHPNFKAIKMIELNLWYITKDKKFLLKHLVENIRSVDGSGIREIEELEAQMCRYMYHICVSEKLFKPIVYGELVEPENE